MSSFPSHGPAPIEDDDLTPPAINYETGEVAPDGSDTAGSGEPKMTNQFLDWLREHLLTLEPVDNAWCPRWWEHPEAVARLFALWLAWEAATVEGADLSDRSSWWVYHWGHHGPILLDRKNGPFRDCDPQRGHLERATREHVRVEMVTPPDSWSPDQRNS